MTVPVVPPQTPDQAELLPHAVVNPYTGVWWTNETTSGVPESVMGWLVAQGWNVTAVSYDSTTNPPTASYALGKSQMSPLAVLLTLCNEWTDASQKAQDLNTQRYNDIITDWRVTISSTQEQFDAQVAEQNTSAGIYIADLGTYMDAVDTLIEENQAQLASDVGDATTILGEMNTKLDELEDNADINATTVGVLLTAQAGYLSSFLTDIAAKLAELDTNYSAHLTLIQALLADSDTDEATFIASQTGELTNLQSEYDTHAPTATAFLDSLGATDLARITEQFAATLSVQLQDLIDRGIYSSAVATDITARNTRDKDEQIQALNDRLMREKLANQHSLYGQQVAVRTKTLEEAARRQQISQAVTQWKTATLDRLLEQLQQIDLHQAAGIEKEYAAEQDVSRVTVGERNTLLAQLQDAVKGILAGKDRYAAATMQNASALAEHKHKAIQETMNVAVTRLEGWKSVSAENMKLMAYQLDERNKLMIGLYAFVERREDIGPEWKDMSAMIAGLGDSAGGWLTP